MNENQLYSFEFLPGVEIRAFVDGEEVWFILSDVGTALGMDRTRWSRLADQIRANTVNHVADSATWRKCRVSKVFQFNKKFQGIIPTTLVVNEPALYLFIMQSKRPSARKFQDWVCGEVLPSIRRTGSYSMESFINQKNNKFTQNESSIRSTEPQDKMRFNLSVTLQKYS